MFNGVIGAYVAFAAYAKLIGLTAEEAQQEWNLLGGIPAPNNVKQAYSLLSYLDQAKADKDA
jgi:hypothetical protein